MTTLLIDGDIVIYQAALAAEKAINWGDGLWTNTADEGIGKSRVDETIRGLKIKLGTTDALVCLSSPYNFRKNILPSYKANRKDARKPILISCLREYVKDTFPYAEMAGLEADDVMGIYATQGSPFDRTIVSIDKDLKQIPGSLYNPDKDDNPKITSLGQADYWHMYQTLIGDKTDGYSGCPKVGPVKAEKILGECWDIQDETFDVKAAWVSVVAAFVKAGLTEADALVQARVARILRYDEYSIKTNEPILWEPPK